MTVFGESVRTGGWLVIQIIAVLAIAFGCVDLSRSLSEVHGPQPTTLPAGGPATEPTP